MCDIRRIIAYLCLNMSNFDAVDFSERRSEEVISFFWRSVYIYIYIYSFIHLWEIIVKENWSVAENYCNKVNYYFPKGGGGGGIFVFAFCKFWSVTQNYRFSRSISQICHYIWWRSHWNSRNKSGSWNSSFKFVFRSFKFALRSRNLAFISFKSKHTSRARGHSNS